jgi:hypothetical protein
MTVRRQRVWYIWSLLVLSAVISMMTADASLAQSKVDSLARFEGRYSGTISRRATCSFDLKTQEAALLNQRGDQHIPVQFSVSAANDYWTVELRHADDQFLVPLPSVVSVRSPKALAPLSPVKVDGLPSEKWTARATQTSESFTIYFVELNSLSTPVQMQISLQPVGKNIYFILWRIDEDGHRGSAWTSTFRRE